MEQHSLMMEAFFLFKLNTLQMYVYIYVGGLGGRGELVIVWDVTFFIYIYIHLSNHEK